MSPDPVGSLAEEAAKLVSVLSSMQSSMHSATQSSTQSSAQSSNESSTDAGAHDESHDPLAPECRYCPLCAVARAARSMTPEVREHLASAATSLVLALKGFLEEAVSADAQPTDSTSTDAGSSRSGSSGSGSSGSGSSRSGGTPVEKIDLAED